MIMVQDVLWDVGSWFDGGCCEEKEVGKCWVGEGDIVKAVSVNEKMKIEDHVCLVQMRRPISDLHITNYDTLLSFILHIQLLFGSTR